MGINKWDKGTYLNSSISKKICQRKFKRRISQVWENIKIADQPLYIDN